MIANLTDEENSRQFIESVINEHGAIDAAILTVGGFATGKIAETKMADVQKQFELNFETAYNTARPIFIQMMKQNSGRVFMVGSKPGLDAANGRA